jgi:hypothetical protein
MTPRTLILAGATALVLTLAGSAVAQQTFAARWLARQEAAIDRIGLDAAQRQQLDQLLADQREFRRAAHAELGVMLDEAQADLNAPDADLHQIAAEADRTLFAMVAEARALRSQRMAFYDSLDERQQADVRSLLAQKLERAKRLHAFVGDFVDGNP